MSYAAAPREDAVDYLQMRKGVAYQVNHSKPFTGQFEEKFDNGQICNPSSICWWPGTWLRNELVPKWASQAQGQLRRCELQGKAETWYPNGQKKAQLNYKDTSYQGLLLDGIQMAKRA